MVGWWLEVLHLVPARLEVLGARLLEAEERVGRLGEAEERVGSSYGAVM